MPRAVRLSEREAAGLLGEEAKKPSKYKNIVTTVDGIVFHSRAEANRWVALCQRQQASEIADLERQPRYVFTINGQRVGTWTGDFRYRVVATGETVVEDVKSRASRTEAYMLRRRLMQACHGITISEVG